MIRCGYCGDIMETTEEEFRLLEFYKYDEEKINELFDVSLDCCAFCRHMQKEMYK